MEVKSSRALGHAFEKKSMAPTNERVIPKAESPVMKDLERVIAEIASTDIPVLVVGESGSGKETIARQIHQLSSCADMPFVKLVCATLTPQITEQLLYFDRESRLVEALSRAGTVFLDEVGDLDQAIQPRILHVLPDVGRPSQGHWLHARIISSTGRHLQEEISQGHFREELYYRLNGVCLRLPPLRHRREDIPALVEFFLNKYSALLGRPKPRLTDETLAKFVNYHWPGNIRQLGFAVKKAVALGDGEQALRDLDANGSMMISAGGSREKLSLKQASRAASRQAEHELILKALERTHWNRKRAARELRISYKALLYKLKQIGLNEPAYSSYDQGEQR